MKKLVWIFSITVFFLSSCRTYQAKPHDFPRSVDTRTKPIEMQKKKVYALSPQGVYADNLFDGARLNDFTFVKDNLFQATISPENSPINHSAYYAFRVWSNTPKTIEIKLKYTKHFHRYTPKVSKDGKNWEDLDPQFVRLALDSINAIMTLDISSDTLWIAGQEVQNSTHVKNWCDEKAKHANVNLSSFGKSKMGKDLWLLDIHNGDVQKKDVIIIMCRQHPPEVTGYFAMQAFIDEILADLQLSNDFRKKYRILVFPLMNPDGVDLGHWRHNAGGVDLNRDWAYYRQPENRQIADFIVRTVNKNKSDVIFALDFHSTFNDVYYTNQEIPKHIPEFKDYWLQGVSQALGEKLNERSSNVGSPVSKGWIYNQFNAIGITYEIGDGTPRHFIKEKGKVSATEMMKLLILKN